MDKYKCVVLLPLTDKATGNNPIGYPLMVFDSDPNLVKGERRTLRYEDQGSYIYFNALVVNCSKYQEYDTHIIAYLFELEDRDLALQIAKLVKNQNLGMFEEDNLA